VKLSILLLMFVFASAAFAQKGANLQSQVKITRAEAEKIALAKEPGTIKEGELEKEHGKLIYSFDILVGSTVHEVNVDAINGAVVEDSVESAVDEAKEKAQEQKKAH